MESFHPLLCSPSHINAAAVTDRLPKRLIMGLNILQAVAAAATAAVHYL